MHLNPVNKPHLVLERILYLWPLVWPIAVCRFLLVSITFRSSFFDPSLETMHFSVIRDFSTFELVFRKSSVDTLIVLKVLQWRLDRLLGACVTMTRSWTVLGDIESPIGLTCVRLALRLVQMDIGEVKWLRCESECNFRVYRWSIVPHLVSCRFRTLLRKDILTPEVLLVFFEVNLQVHMVIDLRTPALLNLWTVMLRVFLICMFFKLRLHEVLTNEWL